MSAVRCAEPECGGAIQPDGYCDTCGTKAAPSSRTARRTERARQLARGGALAPNRCPQPGCAGVVGPDGYCDTCGTKAPTAPLDGEAPDDDAGAASGPAFSTSRASRIGRTLVTGSASARGPRRTSSTRTAMSSERFAIGDGIVSVPPARAVDPSKVILADAVVAEDKRFCSKCGAPVGRSKGDRPGRDVGFCGSCRHPYDFVPKLAPGQLVAGQYEVAGCLAHGGLGWIYLARDKAVNDRWVVLKGLLDAGDEAGSAAAVNEKRFLSEVQHPTIVEIHNFATHRGSGYIVMEYVNGTSLKQILKQRREAAGPEAGPLSVDQAIAYILATLPAVTYLHERQLVYCDFKPENVIQVDDQVKLIDLGGVRRLDDPGGDVYGTVGFQAPEIAEVGPSIASDVYTIGRTLAVLTMDFRGYQSTYQYSLPDPLDHPVLVEHESFHRFLLKATAPHPDDRFQAIGEMGDQLVGVFREVVARERRRPQPGPSAVFAPPTDEGVPALALDPTDPAAGFLANLTRSNPAEIVRLIEDAVTANQVKDTIEVRLRKAKALLDTGRRDDALELVAAIEVGDPWEWRAVWLRGLDALASGTADTAVAAFERCLAEVPGELATKLAAAMAAEAGDDIDTADALYDVVSSVDPSYVSAASGLARCRLARSDVPGALAAFDRIPSTHRAHEESRVGAARALSSAGRFTEAFAQLAAAGLDEHAEAEVALEIYARALDDLVSGAVAPDSQQRVGDHPLDETGMRLGVESTCRRLASFTHDRAERYLLVDRGNRVRPLTIV